MIGQNESKTEKNDMNSKKDNKIEINNKINKDEVETEKNEEASCDCKCSNKEDLVTLSKKEHEDLLACKEAKEKLAYAYAEFDNYKKRQTKEYQQQVCFANENLVKDLLPVLDNLTLAIEHAGNDSEGHDQLNSFVEGVNLTIKQLLDIFKRFGIEEVTCVGEKFDPNFHEALDQRSCEGKEPGTIVAEYQKGYIMKGRLVRPSKVSVAKKTENIEKK